MSHSDFWHLAQLEVVPAPLGTTYFTPKKFVQPFDFIDFFHFGTTWHKQIRL